MAAKEPLPGEVRLQERQVGHLAFASLAAASRASVGNMCPATIIQIIWNFIYSGISLWNHDMCLYMELLWLISMEFMLIRMRT
jgi:hypothetical protein